MKENIAKTVIEDSFYVKEKSKLLKIYLADIIAFESKLHDVIIYTCSHKHIVHWSLSNIKKMLKERSEFIQIHRSYIISEKHIKIIKHHHIELTNEIHIPIGRIYKKQFEEIIRNKVAN